jgi:hypothetical protein
MIFTPTVVGAPTVVEPERVRGRARWFCAARGASREFEATRGSIPRLVQCSASFTTTGRGPCAGCTTRPPPEARRSCVRATAASAYDVAVDLSAGLAELPAPRGASS